MRVSAISFAVFLVLSCGGGEDHHHGSPTGPSSGEAKPTSIAVSPSTVTLSGSGRTKQLNADVKDQYGGNYGGVTVNWSSSDNGVATVSSSGLVTSVSGGTATITATAGSLSGSVAVTVEDVTIQSLADNLMNHIPSWTELKPFTDAATRLSYPSYQKRALIWGADIQPSDGNYARDQMVLYDKTWNDYGANISGALSSVVPPFVAPGGGDLTYPLPTNILDEKLRSITTMFLREKSLGRLTTLINFWPPSWDPDPFTSEAAFNDWIDNQFLPNKVEEAKAAERMKMEYYVAWPLEFELFIKNFGGLGDGGFLDSMSEGQILTFATNLKNKIRDAIKQHYTGKLAAHIYNNYYWQSATWQDDLTYEGFDEIWAAFFPQGDVQTTAAYTDAQITAYTTIVQNSGSIPWVATEISIFDEYFPNADLNAIEKDLLETVFTKLEVASPAPVGIGVATGSKLRTQAARDYVKSYFSSR
tara:strand:- start:1038 stop:2456 length:1419 start_codon:yes stop_codon:yes gene_type:complete